MKRAKVWDRSGIVGAAVLWTMILTLPARADVPVSIRVDGGFGTGRGRDDQLHANRSVFVLSSDVELRVRPRSSWLASARFGGSYCSCSYPAVWPTAPQVRSFDFASALIGYEYHRAGGVTPLVAGGIGAGRVETSGPQANHRGLGIALEGTLGLRLVPDPGPVGFVAMLRTHHLIASRASVHATTLGLGLVVYPR